jgi:hypothetical protein
MDGGGRRLPVDSNCGRPSADGAAARLRRTASLSAGGRPPRRTSVGSSDASGCPPDAAVDVRMRDNPATTWLHCGERASGEQFTVTDLGKYAQDSQYSWRACID